MLNAHDMVYSKHYYQTGEVVAINEGFYTIAWDEYHDGLFTADEYDDFELPIYDDRFYGTYSNNDINKYKIERK